MPESVSGVDEILRGLRGRQLHPRPGQIEPRVYLADAEAAVLAAASPDERLREALEEIAKPSWYDATALREKARAALVAADREAPSPGAASPAERLREAAQRLYDATTRPEVEDDGSAYRYGGEAMLDLSAARRDVYAALATADREAPDEETA